MQVNILGWAVANRTVWYNNKFLQLVRIIILSCWQFAKRTVQFNKVFFCNWSFFSADILRRGRSGLTILFANNPHQPFHSAFCKTNGHMATYSRWEEHCNHHCSQVWLDKEIKYHDRIGMKNYIILTRIGWAAAAGWLSSPWTALLKARCRFSRSPSISKSQHTPPLTGSRPGKRRHLWISFKTRGILFGTAIFLPFCTFQQRIGF